MLATQLAAEGARGVMGAVTLDVVNDLIQEMCLARIRARRLVVDVREVSVRGGGK